LLRCNANNGCWHFYYCFFSFVAGGQKDSSLIKPIFGAAGRMGKIASEAPALEAYPKLKGSFCADLSATRSYGPSNLGKPNNILKGFGGYGRPNL
jgi:hypothetical protein